MNDFARHLRVNQTEAEKRLWYHLRNRQICGAKFRRQAPIGRYIVDFVCFEYMVIIELDGGQHASPTRYDERRTAWLKSQGFEIVRFWNNEVMENMDGVWQRIVEELTGRASVACTPHPDPLPQGERE
jgi:very-short-patch-repair endonuclease